MRKICPALAFGNAVVMKPSQITPAANFFLAELSREFFSDDLIQVAMVSGRAASEVVSKGNVHGVSFTGSVPTGKRVYAAAALNPIQAQLELGGKNGAILNDTDDLEAAITQIMGAAFMTSGQRCTATSRVLLREDLAAETKGILTAKANAMKLGPGQMPTATLAHSATFHIGRMSAPRPNVPLTRGPPPWPADLHQTAPKTATTIARPFLVTCSTIPSRVRKRSSALSRRFSNTTLSIRRRRC